MIYASCRVRKFSASIGVGAGADRLVALGPGRWRRLVWFALGLSLFVGAGLGAAQAQDSEQPRSQGAGAEEGSPNEPESAPRRSKPIEGDRVQVVFENRDRVEGIYLGENPREYILRIKRVEIRVDKGRVDRLVVLAPARERYAQMRASINDDDVERLVVLSLWLREHELYEEALTELNAVLAQAPNHAGALRLMRVVEELASLERTREEAGEGQDDSNEAPTIPGGGDRPNGSSGRTPEAPFPLLTPDQINLMKVYEFTLDNPPKVVIPRSTIERLLIDYSNDPLIPSTREGREAFYLKPHAEILDTMFRVRARELYSKVQIVDDPESMRLFRDHVHSSWLINSCATTRCHGGPDAGRLWLTNRRPTSTESVYTNFLILERFRLADDEALIDYENPERSMLIHLGLPGDDAIRAHPVVPGWTPVFRSRESRRFRQAVQWIREMYRPRPSYPIEYEPPGERLRPEPIER